MLRDRIFVGSSAQPLARPHVRAGSGQPRARDIALHALTRRAFCFWFLSGCVAVILLEYAAAQFVCLSVGLRQPSLSDCYLMFGIPSFLVMGQATERVFRWFGRSLRRETREIWTWTDSPAERVAGNPDIIQIGISQACIQASSRCLRLLALASLVSLVLVLIGNTRDRTPAYLILLLLTASGAWSFSLRERCLLRADGTGMLGYHARFPVRRRFVPWCKIESCEIVCRYNMFGDCMAVRPTLRDVRGKDLLTLNLSLMEPADQDRLLGYLRSKLPNSCSVP
jgi:hypothetical protein